MSAPIIPGFFPDPTVCRVGTDYYLATSSFEYFPAVPIFHSTDLLTWTQIGHAFDRESQLDLQSSGSGVGGIYAPTLRYHDGTYFLITTNVSTADQGHMIVTSTDPAGPWSDPVFAPGFDGIDPDLTWDADGMCHLTWSSYAPGLEGIAQVPFDVRTGTALGPARVIWKGTGLAWPESPHLYLVDGRWILTIAEGGTERGHCITVARSRNIDGPYESAAQNPIFTHRSTPSPIQNVGHGDLVQTPTGEWAMVYLAVRVAGITPGFHVNGRETFLAGIDWADGWPVVDEHRYEVPPTETGFSDEFAGALDLRWISPGSAASGWTEPSASGGLDLHADPTGGTRLLAVRARDPEWSVSADVDAARGTGGLVIRLDDDHWCSVEVGRAEIVARLSLRAGVIELGRTSRVGDEISLWLRVTVPEAGHNAPVGPDVIELGAITAGESASLGSFDGRYLSTEVAGGFTGRVVGVAPSSGTLRVSSFSYRPGRAGS
ncbi:Beta-xylosidase [Agromyces sp. CF514]|uniref:glycoside hydrolase family 43 protein n=1 Tax=Agromyces sp. CF514 TaxID=1881031 RepID=UPI0008E6916D|nr:glycoside hydrolase family 43 protein [Agromyces sp. CF514]SFR84495.1 Beta-xylosidase [Agromyces sp. CF514]